MLVVKWLELHICFFILTVRKFCMDIHCMCFKEIVCLLIFLLTLSKIS